MGILDRFRKKKIETIVAERPTVTELEEFCGDDKEVYQALFNTMFLDPRKTGTSIEEAVQKAKDFEGQKDSVKARVWYEIAGGLAIYENNPKKVVEYFTKLQELSPGETYFILKIPEKAVSKAQEYYKKYLKEEEKPSR